MEFRDAFKIMKSGGNSEAIHHGADIGSGM